MTLTRFHKSLAAAAFATLLAGTAVAQPPPPPDADGPRAERFDADKLPKHLEALNLSDAQKAQLKTLRESNFAKRKAEHESGKALHESLRNLTPASPSYTAEVDRVATQMGQRHAQHIRDRAAYRAQEWAILTPAQQSQLSAMPKPEFEKPMRWKHKRHAKRQAQ